MNVIAYARYSGSKQSLGTSVERQIELIEAEAERLGITITERLIDRGKSAFHAAHRRGHMGRLLSRVASGDLCEGDIILVEMIDRMSREKVMVAFDQLRTFTNAGVTIVTTVDGVRLNAETFDKEWSRIIEPLAKMAAAHAESANKSTRTTDNWQRARARGVNMTTALPGWLESKTGKPRPDRVVIVETIFDLCLSGLGCSVIAKTLNARGERAWGNGKPNSYTDWSSATVAKLLKNRAVMGEYQPRSKGEVVGPVVGDYFPEIISPDTFFKAQKLISARTFSGVGSGRRATEASNIFRGLVNCASCRRRMILTHAGGVRYLRCYGSKGGVCSNNRGFNYDKLEEGVLKAVSEIELNAEAGSARIRGTQGAIASTERDIETISGTIDFLVGELLSRRSPALSKRLAEEEARLDEAMAALDDLRQRLAGERSPLSGHQADVVSAYQQLMTADDKASLRQRLNVSLSSLVTRMGLTANHTVMMHLRDHTTYVMHYGLRADLPPKTRVGARPVSDYEWVAVRIGHDEMLAAMATGLADLDEALPA